MHTSFCVQGAVLFGSARRLTPKSIACTFKEVFPSVWGVPILGLLCVEKLQPRRFRRGRSYHC